MTNRIIICEKYLRFKNRIYQVLAIAKHTELVKNLLFTKLYIVISKSVRDLIYMFASEVDHEKYPDVKHKYRFTRIKFIVGEKYQIVDE